MDCLSCPVETQLKPCTSLHIGVFIPPPAASILALGPCTRMLDPQHLKSAACLHKAVEARQAHPLFT